MYKKDSVTIYTIPSFIADFKLDSLNINTISQPVQKMAKLFMEEGRENDICIMPYVTQYKSLLTTFRSKNLFGPVFFLSDESIDHSIAYDIHKRGAILIDIRDQQKDFVRLILVFTIENQKLMASYMGNRPMGDNELAVEAIQNQYSQNMPEPKSPSMDRSDFSDTKRVQSVLAEVLEQPEILSFDKLYTNSDMFDSKFSFNLNVTRRKDNRNLSFSCMAKLYRMNPISNKSAKQMLFFSDFHPEFSIKFLRRMVSQVTKEDITRALKTSPGKYQNKNSIECLFNLDGVHRTFFMLPALKKDEDVIGFIPISNAFVQNRQFFRIEPPKESPIKAFVASTLTMTQQTEIIDVSERGVSFYSEYLIKKNSEISVFLTWEKTKLVCHGIVRFTNSSDKSGRNIIGIELYVHQDERAKLRKYVFNCQIEIMKTLREEYA